MKNVAASTAIPTPGLVAATTRPPSAAPPIQLAFWPRRRIAFAGWSSGCGTVCGTIRRRREEERGAEAVDRAENHQLPHVGMTAQKEDCDQALASAADDVRQRPSRGGAEAGRPRCRRRAGRSPVGIERAARTKPRSAFEPVSSRTANASATFANALPMNDVVRPRKRKRKSRRPSGPARSRRINGAEGDRTPDLRHAMAALSQLSYGPLRCFSLAAKSKSSAQFDSTSLVVSAGS